MHKLMRATVAITMTTLATIAGFAVGEPALGLLGFFGSIAYLKADWSN